MPVDVGSGPPHATGDNTWYLTAKLGGKEVQFLVDSGSNRNLLSEEVFKVLPVGVREGLKPTSLTLLAANDQEINVMGQIMLEMDFQGQTIRETFIVAHMGPLEGILGMRFLQSANAYMGFREGVLCCGDMRFQLETSRTLTIFDVRLAESVSIPAEHGLTVRAVVDNGLFVLPTGPCAAVVEGKKSDIEVAVPRSVVAVSRKSGRYCIDLSLTNFSQDSQVIEAGEVVGSLEVIERVQSLQRCSRVGEAESEKAVPPHLEELSKAAAANLNDDQSRQVNALLRRFASSFAGPDGQLGYTTLVTHSIDTQGAIPIKCRYRPPGHAMKKVVDENLDKI